MNLRDRVAIVTGSSSGIGRGVALAFAQEGARVVVNYPDAASAGDADGVQRAIEQDGGRAMTIRCDVSDEAAVSALVEAVSTSFGPPDILVNNAGIATAGAVHELPVADWDRLFSVHVRGTFLMTRAVLPAMLARGSGRIISTASQLAYKGAPGFSHYTAAKGAIISFTRSLALELGDSGITANCVAPGATRTRMLADVSDETLEAIRAGIPLGRLADVDDIVPSYVFLASEAGRHYHGQCLSPNGGDVFL